MQIQHLGSCTALGLCHVYTAHHKLQNWQALWATPAQEKVCKGYSISFSFGKDTAFVSSLVSALHDVSSWSFFLSKNYKPDEQLHTNVLWAQMTPQPIPACMLELPDFVFSQIPANEVRELPAWTRQPGYTADLLTCFSLDSCFHVKSVLHKFSLFKLISHCKERSC